MEELKKDLDMIKKCWDEYTKSTKNFWKNRQAIILENNGTETPNMYFVQTFKGSNICAEDGSNKPIISADGTKK